MKNTRTTLNRFVTILLFITLIMPYVLIPSPAHAAGEAPGGVSTGLGLWLKADDGPTVNASDNLTLWNDRSGNSRNADIVFSDPQKITNGLNFNPVIRFDGGDFFYFSGSPFVTSFTEGEVFSVPKQNTIGTNNGFMYDFGGSARQFHYTHTAGGNAVWDSFGSNDRLGWHPINKTIAVNPADGPKAGVSSIAGPSVNTQVYHIYNTASGSGYWHAAFDGTKAATTSTNTVDFSLAPGGGREHIGAVSGAVWNGETPEIILYNRVLTETERNQVNSYLAIKYGTSLDQTAAQHYRASDGTIIWDATANSTYSTGIAGIGRDDSSSLNQKQSQSASTTNIVTIGHGSIAATNADNTNSFTADRSFMLWGHNNATTSQTIGVFSNGMRMARIWKVEEMGTVGTVTVRIPTSALGGTVPVLLRSTDTRFTQADTIVSMTQNGSNYEATIDFSDGDFFTFASRIPGIYVERQRIGGTDYSFTEGGAASSLAVFFTDVPTADVTITLTSDNGDLNVGSGDTTFQFTRSPSWFNTGRDLSLAARDDAFIEGTHNDTVSWSLTSADPNFNGLSKSSALTATITDNDTAGATVTITDSLMSEPNNNGQFCVALTAQPTADVTIALSSSDTDEATVPANVTILAANWNATTNCVTVTAVDEAVGDGPQQVTITTGNVTSTDTNFDALDGSTITDPVFVNENNDPPGIAISTDSDVTTGEDGATATVRFILLSQPGGGANVTIPLSLSDTSEGSLGGVTSITITNANWNNPAANQVTITGVNDDLDDGDITFELITGDPTSADTPYNDLDAAAVTDVVLTNIDNDAPGITITETAGSTAATEGGATDTINVVIGTQPAPGNEVVITAFLGDNLDLGAGAGTEIDLVFTNADWSTPQPLTVTAENDTAIEGSHTDTINYLVSSSTTETSYFAVANLDETTVTITDNDTSTATLSAINGAEGGSNITFTVTLSATNSLGTTVTFDISPSGGSATAGSDYTTFAGETISVANGTSAGTLTVAVTDDSVFESAETVQATISNPSSGLVTIGTANATATITDNDVASSSGGSSGSTVQGRVRNLTTMGKTDEAETLKNEWPQLFSDASSDTNTPSPSVTPPTTCPSYTFTRNLRLGDRGEDVRALQKLLNCLGFTLASNGPGSPGNETVVFRDRTHAAMVRFQEHYAQDILAPLNLTKGTGYFAEMTRKKMGSIITDQ